MKDKQEKLEEVIRILREAASLEDETYFKGFYKYITSMWQGGPKRD